MSLRVRVLAAARPAALAVLGGVAAGLVGAAMAWLLLRIQALTYGVTSESLLDEVRAASDWRRVAGPLVGGLLAGLGWWWLRRRGRVGAVEDALGEGPESAERLPLRPTIADALLQLLVVGSGASIGREGAPRQASAALAEWLAGTLRVGPATRRAAVAAAAGAGLAAVYNVPLAGVAFTLEVLPQTRNRQTATLALVMSVLATVTAWPVVTNRPTYAFPDVPGVAPTMAAAACWAAVCIPLCAGVGWAFHALARAAESGRPRPSWRLPVAVAAASGLVGAVSIGLPALPGNGKDLMQLAFSGVPALAGFGALLLLKPLATAMCLRSGAVGGLLTPALATGAALGGLVATGLHRLGDAGTVGAIAAVGPASSLPVFALVAAAGVLAVTQRAPIFAATMAWELTRAPLWTIPLLLGTALGAHHLRLTCTNYYHNHR